MVVYASPAERFLFTQILLQLDAFKRPVLQLRNGFEGRSLRALIRGLELEPIRKALAKHGQVASSLATSEQLNAFELSPDAVQFFRESVADLPRPATVELVIGDLFDALHDVGEQRIPEVVLGPVLPGSEKWDPPAPPPAKEEPTLVDGAVLQAAVDALERDLEALPETVEKAAVVTRIEAFLEELTTLLTVPG